MTAFQELIDDLSAFEGMPESRGYDLRLDLAEIILKHLDGKKWTQKKLADAIGVAPSFLTRIIHSTSNCTFETAGKILFALGVKAKLAEVKDAVIVQTSANVNYSLTLSTGRVYSYGKTKKEHPGERSISFGTNATARASASFQTCPADFIELAAEA